MKKNIIIFIILYDFAIMGIFFGLWTWNKNFLVDIRKSLFTTFSSQSDIFGVTDEGLSKEYSFIFEKNEIIRQYSGIIKKQIDFMIPENVEEIEQTDDIIQKAILISMLYSKNGGEACGAYRDIIHNIQRIGKNKGMGCCSDHSEVFIALSHCFDILAREVHHTKHTFNEIFDEKNKKWLFIDTQYAVMAKDHNDKYLSLLEMKNKMDSGEKIDYYFFGNQHHEFSQNDPSQSHNYDHKNDFSYISMTMGNNVYSVDRFEEKINFLPKPMKQFISYILGIRPKQYLFTNEANDQINSLKNMKMILIFIFLISSILNIIAFFIMIQSVNQRIKSSRLIQNC